MNANIQKVDEMMKNQQIKFSVACKAYKLIRRGMSVDAALVIANAREGKELRRQQGKKHMKRKDEKSLEQLVKELEKSANDRQFVNVVHFSEVCKRLEWTNLDSHWFKVLEAIIIDDTTPSSDAMNYIDYEASRRLNSPRMGKDALDLCYSNTNGAEVLF